MIQQKFNRSSTGNTSHVAATITIMFFGSVENVTSMTTVIKFEFGMHACDFNSKLHL